MRLSLALVGVMTSTAYADTSWSNGPLSVTACEMSVELRGAIAEVQLTEHLANTTDSAGGGVSELALPVGAQVVGVTYQQGLGKPARGLAVRAPSDFDLSAGGVLAADPVLVTGMSDRDGHARVRIIVQPVSPDHDVTLGVHWTAIAQIREGAIHFAVPGRELGVKCRGVFHATPGPGARIEKSTTTFEHGAADTELSAVLTFDKPQPVVWTQTAQLGEGWTAQALTIATPATKTTSSRHVLFLIDGSRSMTLIGMPNVMSIVRAVGRALPAGSEVEAVIYDRTAARVLGSWQTATAEHVETIAHAISSHALSNGSDLLGALAVARTAIGSTSPTEIVLVTDGVIGSATGAEIVNALGIAAHDVDLHAISLAPGRMSPHASNALAAAVERLGGSQVVLSVSEIDAALASVDTWLRPAWLDLQMSGGVEIPGQLRAGAGVVVMSIAQHPPGAKLTGHTETPFAIDAKRGPAAALAELALAGASDVDDKVLTRLRARHPAVDLLRAFAVLSRGSSVAAHREAMVAGGGPYTRIVDVKDPLFPVEIQIGQASMQGGSAVGTSSIKLLLMTQLQHAAYVCYQRALGLDNTLAGTAHFTFEIARGEIMTASVTGFESTFASCLVDAAYTMTPTLPNPDYNTDDRVVVTYPLAFSVRQDKPFVVAGDADSSTPIDIDKIEGGPPVAPAGRSESGPLHPGRGKVKAGDTSTPLGDLRPSKSP